MAKNEIVNVLTIKTEESQKTIKGLKKEIADLKKVLENTTIGTEEFDKASKELVAAQLELKTAMSGNKQQTEALAGSYDYLVAEMAKLKKEWRATADEAKRNEIGKEIDNINTQLKELDETIGNNQRKVGAYAEEFAKALNQNNDNVAASATAFKQALAEQDDATISTRTKLESLQKVTSGLTSGYAAVQGVTALLGIENENLEKTFVKLQAAMAIAQGVGGMKDLVEGLSRGKVAFAGAVNGTKMFITGLNGVQKAIIGTGIGALVVAIGLLIANWDKITKMFENINPQRKAAKATAELNLEITKLANQSAGDKIARVKELSIAYSKLGDNLNAKKQFVIDYKDELANMGIEMDNVNDADEIFVKNTDAYIKALMARAKADALKQKATEDYKKGLVDYKFYCFDGKAKALFVAADRHIEGKECTFDFYDINWEHLDMHQRQQNAINGIEKPETFDKMVAIAEKLSQGMPHVRVDLYEVNGQNYFGEMTFFAGGGWVPLEPRKWEKVFGEWITLPEKIV